jgi:calcineurin-like phosphoesterase
MSIRVLHVGDIVGSPGRTLFARVVHRLQAPREQVDLVIANAENSAAGRGITPTLADELFAAGADVLTLGDHTWDQREILPYLDREPRIVRPANFRPRLPGPRRHHRGHPQRTPHRDVADRARVYAARGLPVPHCG